MATLEELRAARARMEAEDLEALKGARQQAQVATYRDEGVPGGVGVGGLRAAAGGALGGFFDEAAGAVQALNAGRPPRYPALPGDPGPPALDPAAPITERYVAARDRERAAMAAYAAEHPVASGVATAAGGAATGLTLAGTPAGAAVASRLPQGIVGQALVPAAGGAAIFGAGESTTDPFEQPLQFAGDVGKAGLVGAVTGGLGYGFGKALSTTFRVIGRKFLATRGSEARKRVRQAFESEGADPEVLAARAREMEELTGQDAVLADLSPGALKTGSGAYANTTARQATHDFLKARDEAATEQLIKALEGRGARRSDALTHAKELTAATQKWAGPAWDRLYQRRVPLTDELEEILSLPRARRAWRAARARAREQGKKLRYVAKDGNITAAPTMQDLDMVQRGLRDMGDAGPTASSEAREQAKSALALRRRLLALGDEYAPEWREMRSRYAQVMDRKRAIDKGEQVARGKLNADDVEELISDYGQAEKESFGIGLVRGLRNQVESFRAGRDVTLVPGLTSTRGRQIFRSVFGDEALDELDNTLEAFKRQRETRNVTMRGSQTAERTEEAIATAEQAAGIQAAESAMRGDAVGALAGLRNLVAEEPNYVTERAINENILDLLYTPGVSPQSVLNPGAAQALRAMPGAAVPYVPGTAPLLVNEAEEARLPLFR